MSLSSATALAGARREGPRATVLAGLAQAELFAGLAVLGFANGILPRLQGIEFGVAEAVLNTFGISIIVWIAFWLCPALMLRAPAVPPTRTDLVVAGGALLAFLLPVHWASWVALTGIALHLLRTTHRQGPASPLRRGAWVLLATTGAMMWGRVLLALASVPALRGDAVLVAWFAGEPRDGNTIRFADGTGSVWIEPGCSSLANISIALLCWVLFSQWRGLRWSLANAGWCLLACVSVVAINVVRISLIVLRPDLYDTIHGPLGLGIASWATMLATVSICDRGTRHGDRQHGAPGLA